MFRYHERMVAMVPRWSIVPRIREQYLAEHSFYVTLYTSQLCELLEWPQINRWKALEFALRHDMAEILTSDIPGHSKRGFVDRSKLLEFEQRTHMRFGEFHTKMANGPDGLLGVDIRNVVKAADLIDEVFYLRMESLLGNKMIDQCIGTSHQRLRKIMTKLCISTTYDAIVLEIHAMQKGVQFFANSDDIGGT